MRRAQYWYNRTLYRLWIMRRMNTTCRGNDSSATLWNMSHTTTMAPEWGPLQALPLPTTPPHYHLLREYGFGCWAACLEGAFTRLSGPRTLGSRRTSVRSESAVTANLGSAPPPVMCCSFSSIARIWASALPVFGRTAAGGGAGAGAGTETATAAGGSLLSFTSPGRTCSCAQRQTSLAPQRKAPCSRRRPTSASRWRL